jgi:hypothetical protein
MKLDPDHAPKPRSLDLAKHRDALAAWLDTQPGLVAELARVVFTTSTPTNKTVKSLANRQRPDIGETHAGTCSQIRRSRRCHWSIPRHR